MCNVAVGAVTNFTEVITLIIKDKTIDGGKGFDWGRVSSEYAKYRDIYPKIFF